MELRDLFERDGVRWALLDVRWSSRRVQPNPDTAPQNRPSVLTMALPCDETDLRSQRFSDASDCGTCGAPVTDRHEPTCPYCGATRTVHIADWRLFRIV